MRNACLWVYLEAVPNGTTYTLKMFSREKLIDVKCIGVASDANSSIQQVNNFINIQNLCSVLKPFIKLTCIGSG